MGVDYYCYVGPYVVCKNNKQPIKVKRRACNTEGCRERGKQVYESAVKFCSQCGTPMIEHEFDAEGKKVNAFDLAEANGLHRIPSEYLDVFKGYDIYTGNRRKDSLRSSFDAQEERVLELTPQMIVDELKTFAAAYNMNALYEAYGEENVQLKWGLIQYGC